MIFKFFNTEIVRLQTMNEAIRHQKNVLQSDKNRFEMQKKEVIEKIDNFDYFNDNVYTMLREIKNILNS